jgi:hypothetical protein
VKNSERKNTATKNDVNEMHYKVYIWVHVAQVEDHFWLFCKRE